MGTAQPRAVWGRWLEGAVGWGGEAQGLGRGLRGGCAVACLHLGLPRAPRLCARRGCRRGFARAGLGCPHLGRRCRGLGERGCARLFCPAARAVPGCVPGSSGGHPAPTVPQFPPAARPGKPREGLPSRLGSLAAPGRRAAKILNKLS